LIEDIVEIFKTAGINFNEPIIAIDPQDTNTSIQTTLLHEAIAEKNILLVKKLIATGIDVNALFVMKRRDTTTQIWNCVSQFTALELSLQLENALKKQLKEAFDDDTVSEITISKLSKEAEALTQIVYVLFHAPSLNILSLIHDETFLCLATQRNYPSAVRKILRNANVDVNASDDEGETTLHRAVAEGFSDICEILLQHPLIDVNKSDEQGNTPLHVATLSVSEIIRDLLSFPKTNINAQNDKKETVLSLTYQAYRDLESDDDATQDEKEDDLEHYRDILALLIRSGVVFERNALTLNTLKALQRFIPKEFALLLFARDRLETLQKLLKQGWKIDTQDTWGATILMYMAAQGDLAVVQLLLRNQANSLLVDKDGADVIRFITTLIKQLRVEIAQSPSVALGEKLYRYEQILAELYAARIELVTNSAHPIILDYKIQTKAKRKLNKAAESSVYKKMKEEKEEIIEIPTVEFPSNVGTSETQGRIVNLLDSLPNELLAMIFAYVIQLSTKK
jgi:ankyrin repeat protein